MKILVLDIETAPNTAHVWALWDQNVGLPQLLQSGYVMCFAAKWHGEKKIHFHSLPKDGKEGMLQAAYDLVNEADAVVHFNGKRFDMPHLNSEWVRLGWTPPSPYQEIDLCQIAKVTFKFPSNKLDYLAGELLGQNKVKNVDGHELWIKCMANDKNAWKQMQKYNEMDTELTSELFDRIRPWIRNLPNPALYDEADPVDHTCPGCGSCELTKEGFAYTKVSKFQRYSCDNCERWSRSGKRIGGVAIQ